MSLTEDFKAGFACEKPDFLPQSLVRRLVFYSCLTQNKDRMTYLVFDSETSVKAILKIALPGSPNNLNREHEILSKLNDPGIPTAIHFEKDVENREYLLRTYAEGDTLADLLERDGVFSERRILEVADRICTILSYLHKQTPPLIYRDISPSNIVITAGGKLSLIDFGISRESKKDQAFDTEYVGNIAFTSPENMGFAKTDPRSDIFALGRLILYLASGNAELPHYEQRVASPALRKIIEKCTRLSPEKRYRSVTQLHKSIQRLLYPPTRKEILITTVAAALIIICGLIFWISNQDKQSVPSASNLLSATGEEVQEEVKIPVLIETRMAGSPYADCVAAVDSHHWYAPAKDGKAELLALGYNNYRVQASSGNQAVFIDTAVTRDSEDLSFVLDFADAPTAAEFLALSIPFGERMEYPLGIEGAETVTLSGQPNGVSAVKVGEQFLLVIDAGVELPGHYAMFLEATNEKGRATMALSLSLVEEKEIVLIHTPQELENVRNNLAGYYKLANDIDLSGVGSFTPIGNEANPFTGIFDGAGFSISGLTVYGVSDHAGLFGRVTNGVVKNLLLHEPGIQASFALYKGTAVIIGFLDRGLIDNCAVLYGTVDADVQFDSGVGGICGVNYGIISSCFNSARINVTNNTRADTGSQAGGIAGENAGYIADCGNIGDVTGTFVAGGIAAFSDFGLITRCYNAGAITAPAYAGDYPAGGIVQLLGRGRYISYCAFEKGAAPVGATVWNGGALIGIVPLDRDDFMNIEALNRAFHIDDAAERWAYSELVPGYPVPAEILK